MSRFIAAFGLAITMIGACTWADCKTDAKAGGLAVLDCAPDLFAHIVAAVHEGSAGWADDVVNFSGDASCLKQSFDKHMATVHACADTDGATCTTVLSMAEKQRLTAAIAIVKAKIK